VSTDNIPTIHVTNLDRSLQSHLNSGVDFVAYAKTEWNAIGISAKIHKDYSTDDGLIFIQSSHDGPRISYEDFPQINKDNIQLVQVVGYDEVDISQKTINRFRRLYGYLTLSFPDLGQELPIITTTKRLDVFLPFFHSNNGMDDYIPKYIEVSGGYGRYSKTSLPSWTEGEYSQYLYNNILKDGYRFAEKKAKERFLRSIDSENMKLFSKENNQLKVNSEAVAAYRGVLPEPKKRTQDSVNNAIIFTQPREKFRLTQSQHKKIMAEAINILVTDGYDVHIKPHPEENLQPYFELAEIYTISLIQNDEAAERLVNDISIDLAVSYASTCLLTLNSLYDIPSYSLIDSVLDETSSRSVKKYCKEFKTLTSGLPIDTLG